PSTLTWSSMSISSGFVDAVNIERWRLTLEQDNALPTSFDLATIATALAADEVAVVE
ncbi:hypothetical protein L195_g056184, partial [Trifolium pratense]